MRFSFLVKNLFALCLLFFAIVTTQAQESKKDANRWEPSIKAFEAADKTNPPPKNAVLFIGSSSMRLWTNVGDFFPEQKIINRGFGGSQVSDSERYVERIVLPYKPKAIVFYAGDNDLAEGKTPEQILSSFKRFAFKVHWALPETKVFFISIKPCPARWQFHDKVVKANEMIKKFCAKEKELTFINVYPAMLGTDGLPRKEIFRPDNLHLNQKGYELWASIIAPYLHGL